MFARIKAALTRHLGPQPAWAWLGELAGGLYLYRRHQAASNTAAAGGAGAAGGPADVGAASYYGGYAPTSPSDSGGLPTGDQSSQPGASPPVVYDPATDSYVTPGGDLGTGDLGAGDNFGNPPIPVPTPPGTVSNTTPRPRGHLSQPLTTIATIGGRQVPMQTHQLVWGGKTFRSQAAFQAWARAHGTSVSKIFAKHPEAHRLYQTLDTTAPHTTNAAATHPPARTQPARPRSVRSTASAHPAVNRPHETPAPARTSAPKREAPKPAARPKPAPKPRPRITRRGI